jgi:hypothetical protein
VAEQQEKGDLFDQLTIDPARDPREKPKFIAAAKAKICPRLTVKSLSGEEGWLDPAKEGHVTLLVFWSMDFTYTKAAVRYADDLARKYEAHGVRAVGILERTKAVALLQESGHSVMDFLQFQGMEYSSYCYCDDFSALRSMGKAARESGVGQVPCFFMIDRNKRVRFFQRGFSPCTGRVVAPEDPNAPRFTKEDIVENAAPGEGIEDYLKRLLEER